MEGRTRLRWVVAALAFGLTALPMLAGAQAATQTTTTTVTTVQDAVTPDMAAPVMPSAARVRALEAINAAGITGPDIAKIMGLMEDLRTAAHDARARSVDIEDELLTTTAPLNPPADQQLGDARRDYFNHVQSIWTTVADRIGPDKANVLRRLVEPTVDTRPYAWTDEHMVAIQQLLDQFDRQIAAGPGAATTETATTTTTTTTETAAAPTETQTGMAHRTEVTGVFVSTLSAPGPYTIVSEPLLTPRQLTDLLQEKYLALNTTPDTQYILLRSNPTVTSPELKDAWEKMLHVWD